MKTKSTIDKISIHGFMQDEDLCPHCEESDIKNLMCQLVLDDDIEEATNYACEISTLCSGCRGDEMSDNNRT